MAFLIILVFCVGFYKSIDIISKIRHSIEIEVQYMGAKKPLFTNIYCPLFLSGLHGNHFRIQTMGFTITLK